MRQERRSVRVRAAHRTPATRKPAALVAALALALAVGAGATVAYLVDSTGPVDNEFSPVAISIVPEEDFEDNVKSDIAFTNTSEVPVYVRATLAVSWRDAAGNIVPQPEGAGYDLAMGAVQTGWFQVDDVYYCADAVDPGDKTPVMLSAITATFPEGSGYQLNVDVLYEAIQASPAAAVEEAWLDVDVDADGDLVKA